MKTRLFVMLPLVAALSLPVIAQQNSSNQQPSQPAAQQDQQAPAAAPAATQDSSDTATGKAPLAYESRQGFWGKINPFARKKYVQRQLNPIRDRMNELDQLTAANSKQIKDVDSRAQQGIQMASSKATEADNHAIDAGNKATQANQTATDANQRLQTVSTAVGNIDQYQPATQVELKFRPGQSILSKKAKDALDDMAGQLKDQKGYVVEVQGFSSGRGTAAVRSSQNMADAVVRYLVEEHDVPVYRIFTLGMGNAPVQAKATDGTTAKARRTVGGRVEVSLLKNSIADLNSQMANTNNAAPAANNAPAANPNEATPATQPATTQTNPALPQTSEPQAAPAQPAAQPPAQQPPAQSVPPANPPQL
jgi:outer membrane protein OmpA-like peptidoglycan-associated protein